MADKQIKISTKMDTADFDRAIEQMQRKMKQMSSSAETTSGGIAFKDRLKASGVGAGSSESERQRAAQLDRQAKTDQEKYIKEQIKREEELGKIYNARLEKIKKINEEMAKGAKTELEAKREIAKLEERNQRTAQVLEAKRNVVTQNLPAPQQYGPPAPPRISSGPTFDGKLFVGAGQALQMLGGVGSSLAASGRITSSAQGSAMQGLLGDQVQNAYAGNLENILFASQRRTANQKGSTEEFWQRQADPAKLLGGLLAKTGAGAMAGSFIPGLGTAAGGLGGFGKGVYDIMTDPMQRSQIFDRKQYEALSAQRQSAATQQNYQAELMKDPTMTAGRRAFAAQSPQNLAFQRQMGLADQQFYSMMDRGDFTKQQLMGESQNIMGAGGSTRAARGLSGFSNQLARDYDLTNASQVVGRLSGTMGSAASSQNAAMKMLAESFKIGLDSSEFREENRKFMTITSEMAYKSGATSSGAGNIAEMFSRFVASPTSRGLEAAQSGYQRSMGFSGETGGARGAIGAASILGSGYGNTSRATQNAMQTLTSESMESEAAQPMLMSIAKERYKSSSPENIEKVKADIRKKEETKQTVTAQGEKARNKLKNLKMGPWSQQYVGELKGTYMAELGATEGVTDPNEALSIASSVGNYMPGARTAKPVGGPSTVGLGDNKAGDVVNSAVAQEGRVMNQLLKDVSDTFKTNVSASSTAVEEFTKELIKATQAFKGGDKSLLEKLYDKSGKVFFPEEQSKAGGK
jgi:hypothetical protein